MFQEDPSVGNVVNRLSGWLVRQTHTQEGGRTLRSSDNDPGEASLKPEWRAGDG